MSNLMSFVSSLASYLLVYGVFITTIIVAFVIGFSVRKNKNKTEAAIETEAEATKTK